jgi:hypothetical protein
MLYKSLKSNFPDSSQPEAQLIEQRTNPASAEVLQAKKGFNPLRGLVYNHGNGLRC